MHYDTALFIKFLIYLLFDISVIRANYIATNGSRTCKAIKAVLTFCKRCDSMRVPFANYMCDISQHAVPSC